MKILTFSDVVKWEGYKELVDKVKPQVIALAGDLTSDGFASFWDEALERIPAFKEELRKSGLFLDKDLHFTNIGGGKNLSIHEWTDVYYNEWLPKYKSIEDKYRNSKEFEKNRKRMHVDKFYQFLRYAGKKSKVLVVKGDHDEDFKNDYIPEKINKIHGCSEISGKLVEINGVRFLGLGFNETHYLRILKPTIEEFKGKVDVVITHCEQRRVPLVSMLKPKIIIRGHFGYGKFLVNGIPSVFTNLVKYTTIELRNKKIPRVSQYTVDSHGKIKLLKEASCKSLFAEVSEFEMYKWLKPYHET